MAWSVLGALLVGLQLPVSGSVGGVVRDAASGAPLAGAMVLLPDLDRGTLTAGDGTYLLRDVPPGPQHLAVRHIGYEERIHHLLVPADGRLVVDVALRPVPVPLRTVRIDVTLPLRGAEAELPTAYPDRHLGPGAFANHPTLAQPDAFQALAGGEVVLEPEVPTGVHVRGGAADQTGFLLDGVPVLNPYHAAGLFSAWNPDAIESLEVSGAAPSPALPDALAGTVQARLRRPGPRFAGRAAVSNVETRLTVDGPVGRHGGGYLVAVRRAFPGSITAKDEGSYLGGRAWDGVAAVRRPLARGELRLLAYHTANRLDAARAVPEEASDAGTERNAFRWHSSSAGVRWSIPGEGGTGPARWWSVEAWSARTGAVSDWLADAGPRSLSTERRDAGGALRVAWRGQAGEAEAGIRHRAVRTDYRVEAGEAENGIRVRGGVHATTLFARFTRQLGAALRVRGGGGASLLDGRVRVAPRLELVWSANPRLSWTVAYIGTHQLAQSLRNAESIVGTVFPADLFVAVDDPGVPVPSGHQVVVAGAWRPRTGIHLGAQAYHRTATGLLLVPPVEREPFALAGWEVGDTRVQGAAAEVTVAGAVGGLVGSWGWQRVRLGTGEDAYRPRWASGHTVEAGAIVFPGPTSSLRASVSAAFGRAATLLGGPLEWEGCNILDQGCEFAGSPRLEGRPGGSTLPAYVRLDLGGRRHWHVRLGGAAIQVGVHATLTNVLGRRNALTLVREGADGSVRPVGLLPFTPLVLGLEASF